MRRTQCKMLYVPATCAQVPFEQVPDLVATRRVLLREGWAFVSRHEVASLVVGHFRCGTGFWHALVSPTLCCSDFYEWAVSLCSEDSTTSEAYFNVWKAAKATYFPPCKK
jgi:DNA primase large subunit